MRLGSIKLAGFKSFVDPTTINLASNLTAVVGPNGCGKSNVIDAIRWVMGESSAKQLRGESLTDVIFSGSTARKSVGQASVELRFENIDGALGGEYASYNEISVKRVVTRDGDSQYYLNGTKCRKRDITDIFLGTGLGPRSYAIIEQGMISRFIEAKPDDLRVYLEEAAGISKYKERRRETETRINHTRENLSRLADIEEELGKQLSKLEKQAETASRYAVLKNEESLLQAQCYALGWQVLEAQLSLHDSQIRERTTAIEGIFAQRQHADMLLEKESIQLVELREALQVVQKRFYAVGSEISRFEQRQQNHQERALQLEKDKSQTQQSLLLARSQLKQDQEKLESLNTDISGNEPVLAAAKEMLEIATENLAEAEINVETWRQQWEAVQQQSQTPSRHAEVEKTKITQLEARMRQATDQVEKCEKEAAQLLNDDLYLRVQALTSEEQQREGEALAIEECLQSAITQRETLRTHQREVTQLVRQQQKALDKLFQRRAQLEGLIQAALGKDNKPVQEWLTKHNIADCSRLAELMTVMPGYERAVEMALGSSLESVCLSDRAELATLVQDFSCLTNGSVQLLMPVTDVKALALTRPMLRDKITAASDLILNLLSGICIVETLEEALSLQGDLAEGQSVITPEGIWFGPNWVRIHRAISQDNAGVLARKNELSALSEQIAIEEAQIAQLEESLQTCQTDLIQAEQQAEVEQRQKFEIHQKLRDIGREVSAKRAQLEQFSHRKTRIAQDLQEHRKNLEAWQFDINSARQNLQSALDAMANFEHGRITLSEQKDNLFQLLQSAREAVKLRKDNAYKIEIAFSTTQAQHQALAQNTVRQVEHISVLEATLETQNENILQNEAPIPEIKRELEVQIALRLEVENTLRIAEEKVSNTEAEYKINEQRRAECEAQVEKARSELEQVKLAWQVLTVHKQTAEENLAKTNYTIESLIEELSHISPQPVEADWKEKLEKTQHKIEKLGAINLAAIEEFTAAKERKEYLSSQQKDLHEALATLEEAIQKIDKETRTRFKETFDEVNTEFKRLFPKLFGGGQAWLELVGNDLLETGVTIIARPPGKRNSTIHLLSGGEKALTAVALVFSIFKLNPAPFCLLDEVDAPLDDSNVGRFCELVKEMSETVQFIFISHNKLAMDMAEQLQGVTMREPGVSRLVTVDIQEATRMVQA